MTLPKIILILLVLNTAILIAREFALNDREREMVEDNTCYPVQYYEGGPIECE